MVFAEPAGAHTDFDFSVPTDGASVGEPVSEVTVAFTQPVTLVGNGFEVFDPQQNVLQPFAVTDDDTVFRLQFDPPLAGGPVGVKYSVTAEDGHLLAGSFSFTVAVDAPPPTTTAPTATASPATASPATAPTATASTTASTTTPATDTPLSSAPADTASEIDIASELSAPPELVAAQDEVISEPSDSEGSSNAGLLIGLAIAVAVAAAVFLGFRARTSTRT